jgi:pSer/pThr/pTyr-binding forkhead associated (FHA) protein
MVVLYAFIGWTIFTLWSDLKFQSQVLTAKKNPGIKLSIENASDDPMIFTQNELTIGRDETCEFVVSDPTISGRHARLTFRNLHWWIDDLGSTNGTYLNDEKIETPTVLITGDEIRIGKNVVLVEIELLT